MEKRFLAAPGGEVEVRALEEGGELRKLVGYAAKYNVRSEVLGSFVEEILPGAFDGVLGNDVVALFNHDPSMVLGRSTAGTLRLTVDEIGLRYECDLAGDEISRRVAAYIADGRVRQSSFSFTVPDDGSGDDYQQLGDGMWLRRIKRVNRLYDVAPVTYPAYPDATVTLRALEAGAAATLEARMAEIRRQAEARRRELELFAPR